MKLNKGDSVRFLDSTGEGIVTKVGSDGTIYVLDETGFEIPVSDDELILIGNAPAPSKHKETIDNEAPINEINDFYPDAEVMEGNDEAKALFAMVPQPGRDATDADLKTFIINDSNYIIFYNLLEKQKENHIGIDAGIVEPNTKIELFTLMRHEVGKSPDYIFQLVFYKKGKYNVVAPINKTIIISPIKLYTENTFKENDFFYEKSLIFDLTKKEEPSSEELIEETETLKKIKELQNMVNSKTKMDLGQTKRPRRQKPEDKREIDLHINELIDNVTGLENKDILDIQMKKFYDEMTSAIKDNIKKIVFIHGIGNGTLKNEVRKVLNNKYSKYAVHDASFKEYGFGATLVVLQN